MYDQNSCLKTYSLVLGICQHNYELSGAVEPKNVYHPRSYISRANGYVVRNVTSEAPFYLTATQ